MNASAMRTAVVEAARAMNAAGLNAGRSGNVSARTEEGILITPSAVPYHELAPDDLPLLSPSGEVLREGSARPSTEWRMHTGILAARPEVGAVVHAHPVHATALACLHREIPPFHYMVALAGGNSIRCSGYAPFGTAELAHLALDALEGRTACLLANHGILALGPDPGAALELGVEIETLAHQYLTALQAGDPVLLTEEQMAQVHEQFRGYGR